ncbi:MAG: hypothetical protein WC851_03065 [Candidatus Shapirobacteria bacterium]|jgi:uncharacterized HAD superfamily protein
MQKLGIDFDGVIQDSSFLKKDYCKSNFGIDIPLNQGKRGYLITNNILTESQYDQMVSDLYETELGLEAKIVENADTIVNELAKNYEISIVTSRSPLGVFMAKKWLGQNNFPTIEVIGTNNKDKLGALTGFDYYIDDDLSKLLPLVHQISNLYLLSWEYNQGEKLPPEINRVNDWKEISRLLKF